MTKQTYFNSDMYLYNNLGCQQYKFDDTWPRIDHSQNVVYGKNPEITLFRKSTSIHK